MAPVAIVRTCISKDCSPHLRTMQLPGQCDGSHSAAQRRKRTFVIKGQSFRVDARYSPVKTLGSGAYGVVCSARDSLLERDVAIKKVFKVFDNLADAKRTLREIKLMRHLHEHPLIVSILDMELPDDPAKFNEVYMVLELVDTDLHRIIQSKQVFSLRHIQHFVYSMLVAAKYMHSANILHRDIKPSNILVNADCEIRICDFGLARGVSSADGTDRAAVYEDSLTEYVVTRWYRAPEIMCSCKDYGAKIDVWSIGCIFGELFSRKPVFPADNYIHQLNLIFDILGTPTREDASWMSNSRAYEYIMGLPPREKMPWRKLFPGSKVPDLALDLLDRMLVFNPSKRISVDDALAHPWLSSVRKPALEKTCSSRFDFGFEQARKAKDKLQASIYDEICVFHEDYVDYPAA